MYFRTISDLNELVYKNYSKIPYDVDCVVGIPRSGLLVASLIALYRNLPLLDIESLKKGEFLASGDTKPKKHWITNLSDARKILIVEDSINLGRSIDLAKKELENFEFLDKVIFLAAYVVPGMEYKVDITFESLSMPCMFEWNYMHHRLLAEACMDIDGVLCDDPYKEQDDDGDKYIDFIKNANLKFRPTVKVNTLVTTRIEKYRDLTEEWLEKNGIEYDNLIMMPCDSLEDRLKLNQDAEYKAECYKKNKQSIIFIESNSDLAEKIAKISGKGVFCTDNQFYYNESHKETIRQCRNVRNKKIWWKILSVIPRSMKDYIKKYIKK